MKPVRAKIVAAAVVVAATEAEAEVAAVVVAAVVVVADVADATKPVTESKPAIEAALSETKTNRRDSEDAER
jgi:hypothetical protein